MTASGFPASEGTAVVWFRRDLRLHDQPALSAALGHRRVLCLFVLDDRLLHGRYASPNRAWFLRECLDSLAGQIAQLGGALLVRNGRPEEVVPAVAREAGAATVVVSRDYGPFGRARDQRVAKRLAAAGIEFAEFPGVLAVDPEDVFSKAGGPLTVFTPFFRRWSEIPMRGVVAAPERIPPPPSGFERAAKSPWDLDKPQADLLPGGEPVARQRLETWLTEGLPCYADERDRLDLEGSSRLSQDLRWGLLSVNEVRQRLRGPSGATFERELAWRDFYHHLAWHLPGVLREPFRATMRSLPWSTDAGLLGAWQKGRTGYPVVDAAMRQLVATGWMHNRARMVVASFLTKNLFIDYREGERFFLRHLVDGDIAVNNGGWQWASSTGTDAQPYFRVFNPVLQGRRFDPEGRFVRYWIPELTAVPVRYVHEPWVMPSDVQKEAGCVIGRDYPAPIVPAAGAVPRARAFFSGVRGEAPQ